MTYQEGLTTCIKEGSIVVLVLATEREVSTVVSRVVLEGGGGGVSWTGFSEGTKGACLKTVGVPTGWGGGTRDGMGRDERDGGEDEERRGREEHGRRNT